MIERQKRSIQCLADVTEYMLHAMSKNGMDTEQVSRLPEFRVLVHFVKAIIDGELELPNDLTDRIKEMGEHLDIDRALRQEVKLNTCHIIPQNITDTT
jgi:hypothetical protein